MSRLQIRQYLQLIRLPNIFTVPSNVLVGYLALHDGLRAELLGLVASSILLYISGIIFNDYYDYEHDRKSRPNRPLASGRISRRRGAELAVGTLVAANSVALLAAGPIALGVSLLLSAVILAYDSRLKSRAVAGTISMAGARFLNVILGASPALLILSYDGVSNHAGFQTVIVAGASLFFYIVSVMILSRCEEIGASKNLRALSETIAFAVVVAIGVFGYWLGWDRWYAAILSAFAAIIFATFWRYNSLSPASTQKTIRNMILSIIILDSIFLTGIAGIQYGLATILLTIPAFVLGKKMYMT